MSFLGLFKNISSRNQILKMNIFKTEINSRTNSINLQDNFGKKGNRLYLAHEMVNLTFIIDPSPSSPCYQFMAFGKNKKLFCGKLNFSPYEPKINERE